ncbi:MAG: hypothetical protein IH950_16265 [Bacteroidetes bacterium]|nr:hypothetical protein [Bacteroidota bacterium]
MRTIKSIKDFQKEFEYYVNKFEQIRELAYKLKTTPALIVDVLFVIGVKSLENIEGIVKDEIRAMLDKQFPNIKSEVKSEFVNWFHKGLTDRLNKK